MAKHDNLDGELRVVGTAEPDVLKKATEGRVQERGVIAGYPSHQGGCRQRPADGSLMGLSARTGISKQLPVLEVGSHLMLSKAMYAGSTSVGAEPVAGLSSIAGAAQKLGRATEV